MPKYKIKAAKTVTDNGCVSFRYGGQQGIMHTYAFETKLEYPQSSLDFNL